MSWEQHNAMAQIAPDRVAAIMLSWQGLELVSCRRIQTLWAGYGSICEVRARRWLGDAAESEGEGHGHGETLELILKLIVPPSSSTSEDEGHLRKMLSYEVEQYFYEVIAPRLSSSSQEGSSSTSSSSTDYRPAIARCIATTRDLDGKPGAEELLGGGGIVAMLITDLRFEFPIPGEKRAELSEAQVYAALDWLAGFHGLSRAWVALLGKEEMDQLVRPPLEEAERRRSTRSGGSSKSENGKTTVWLNGGYTYLATRRTEYAALVADADSEWSEALCRPYGDGDGDGASVAERVAAFLAPRSGDDDACRRRRRRPYESYIHGDVKSENLFATAAGGDHSRVALFDFQYVGLGLGVCDLAKLFTCSVPLRLLTTHRGDDDDAGDDDGDAIPRRELGMDAGEKRLLEHYRRRLLEIAGFDYDWGLLVRHWEAALVDWLRFQMSWGAWGNTAWLEARVRSILLDDGFREWLLENAN